MLEHEILRIYPWSAPTGPARIQEWPRAAIPDRQRLIVDGSSAVALGSVYERARGRPIWLRWLLGPSPRWEFHEIEDDSLLFTMQFGQPVFGERPWDAFRPRRMGRQGCWSVNDAEGRPVGEVAVSTRAAALASMLAPGQSMPPERNSGKPVCSLEVQALDLQGRTVDVPGDWLDQPAETPLMAQTVFGGAAAIRCATVWREQDQTLLKFDEQIEGEPFLKMLILGAVLVASNRSHQLVISH
jgi:hypothetical protein